MTDPVRSANRKRVVFLDLDGTYADDGVVPAAHVAAVRAARAAGHKVLLCTGRPLAMLPPRILEAGFDGVVAAAGGYVVLGDRVHTDVRFPADVARRTVALLSAHDVAFILEAPDAVYGPPGVDRRLHDLLAGQARHHGRVGSTDAAGGGDGDDVDHEGPRDILDRLVMSADLSDASFGKVTCFGSPLPVGKLAAEIGSEVAALPSSMPGMGDSSGELYLAEVSKAVGIAVVVRELGLDPTDVVAVGDGLNDLEMLEYAGLGVAIEGSDPRVLAAADRTAPPPHREGVATLFAELGLV